MMRIVEATREFRLRGFVFAIELEKNDIKDLRPILNVNTKNVKVIRLIINKIINFARRQHKEKRILVNNGEGEVLLIQIGKIQWTSFVNREELESTLQCAI